MLAPGRSRTNASSPELGTRRAVAVRRKAGLSRAHGFSPATAGAIWLLETAMADTRKVTGKARRRSGLPWLSYGTPNRRTVLPGRACI